MNRVKAAQREKFHKTAQRVITRRGVLWLGQTCNIRCHFCYFLDRIKASGHPEHPFMSLGKAKQICWHVRYYYENDSIDIQGGEPLLFNGIYDLARFCHEIGLHPTLITNGILLTKREICVKLKESGVRDLLISVHALGEVYDTIVGTPGASVKQMEGLRNCIDTGIPFRFNVVLSKWALPQYVDIARLAVETGARVVNFIAFNPFEDQASGKRSSENVPTYSEVAIELNKALDLLAEAGVEANVRYVPLCVVEPRHRKSMYNFHQLPYDPHEWDYASWSWTGQTPQRMRDGDCSPLLTLEEATYLHGRPLSRFSTADKLGLTARFATAKRLVYEKLAAFPKIRNSVQSFYHATIDAVLGQTAAPRTEEYLSSTPNPELYRANGRLRAEDHCKYAYSRKCRDCSVKAICDGFHGDYISLFGAEEARPMRLGSFIEDPCHFIAHQTKVVPDEDVGWLLQRTSEMGSSYAPDVHLHCPICNSVEIVNVGTRSDGLIAGCIKCEHKFVVNRRAVADIVRELYQGLHYWELDRKGQGISSLDDEQQWVGFLRARWTAIKGNGILREGSRHAERILEIGCSEGKVLHLLKGMGHFVVGTEPNRAVAVWGRKALDVPILPYPIEQCSFSPESFDVIISFHAFEHLVDPGAVVQQCGTWLGKGGRLLLEIPCDDKEIDNQDHLHFFSPKSAALMVEAVFGNATLQHNKYTTRVGQSMASLYVSAQKAT